MRRDKHELRRALGLENSAYSDAGYFRMMLEDLHELGLNNGPLVDYDICSNLLLLGLFKTWRGTVVDPKRRCLWGLNVDRSELPTELPPSIDEIRTIRTHHYKLCFSTHGSTNKRCIDIRTSKGRLAVLDLVYHPAASRNRAVLQAKTRKIALNENTTGPNIASQLVEAKGARELDAKIGKLEIADT